MERLKDLAAELKAAYDLQTAAQRRQSEVRSKICEIMGRDEGMLFVAMLRAQAVPPRFDLELVLTTGPEGPIGNPVPKFAVVPHGK